MQKIGDNIQAKIKKLNLIIKPTGTEERDTDNNNNNADTLHFLTKCKEILI